MYIIVGGQKVPTTPKPQSPEARQRDDSEQPCNEEATGWKTWYALAVFGLMGMARGFEESLVATMIVQDSFIEQFQLSKLSPDEKADVKGNIVAMSQLGCIAGALWQLVIGDRICRLWAARLMCLIWMVGVIVYATSNGSLGQLYAGLFVTGIGLGQIAVVAQAYLVECCPSKIRGFAVSTFGASEYLGTIAGYFANYGTATSVSDTDAKQWKLPQIIPAATAAIFLVLLCFSVESPRYLIKEGKSCQARLALSELRGLRPGHASIRQEIRAIELQACRETDAAKGTGALSSLKSLFTTRANLRRLSIAISAQLLAQWSGASSITVYAPSYFSILGVSSQHRQLLYTALIGVVKLLAAVACTALTIDRFGRRRSLTAGLVVQGVAMVYIAACMTAEPGLAAGDSETSAQTKRVGTSAIAFMYLCGVGYAFGWNGIQYLIGSEVFPLQDRTTGIAVVMTVHYADRYGLKKAVPEMLLENALKPYGTFWLFSGVCALGLAWVWTVMPELANVGLEDAAAVTEGARQTHEESGS